MSVPVQTPSKEYIANGTTTAFPLEFNCDKAEYLIVTLNGEEAPVGSWTLANDTVIFNVAPLNGVVVNLERNTPFQRTTNYQLYDNSFRPSAVNKDFDLIWWKLQELGYRDQVIWLALLKEILDRKAADEDLKNYLLSQDLLLKNDYIARDENLKNYIDQLIALITGDPSFEGITTDFVFEGGKTQKEINAGLIGLAYAPDLPNSRLRILAGSVRNTGDGWKWISDTLHTPVGFAPEVTVNGVNLVINYGFTAKRVLTLVATADETLSGLGMQVGGSVGTTFTNLQLKAPIAFTVNTQTGEVTAPSYHVNTINTVVTAGRCVVNHPSDGMTGSAPVVSRIGTTAPNHTDVLMTYGAAQTIFNGAGELDGYISYDGTNWVYSGNLLTPPTMTWVSSAGDGYLEVSHLETDTFNIKIEERDVPIKIKTLSVASNLFRLRFYDNTNTKIITPTTDMQFYFSRKAMVPKNVLRGVYAVRRGYGGILPADLVSATGNIWIFGVMEV